MKHLNKIDLVKNGASAFFIVPGIINLVHTLIVFPEYWIRDVIILLVLSLPPIINRRIFYLLYGVVASLISLLLFFTFLISNSPSQIDISIAMYLTGAILYLIAVAAGIAMIYVGTYAGQKGFFRLI